VEFLVGTWHAEQGNTRGIFDALPALLIGQMTSSTSVRSRGWCFTINNPTDEDHASIQKLVEDAQYVIVGNEVGSEGTPHLQGYCFYKNTTRFSRIKDILPRAHIEKQKGNNIAAIDYCKKDEDYKEWGIPPENNNQKEKWSSIIALAESGNLEAIKSQHPRIYFQHFEKIQSFLVREIMILDGELEHEWWYGPTGTGKSSKVWNDHPIHYAKKKNKWWDGYRDQDVVVIEEWSPNFHMLGSELKIWADRYPFPAEIKGGSLQNIRPKKIIVTSNYTIDQCFPATEDSSPLKRKFKVIHFPGLFRSQSNSSPIFAFV